MNNRSCKKDHRSKNSTIFLLTIDKFGFNVVQSNAGVAKPGQRRRSEIVRGLERAWKFPTTLFLRDSWVRIPPPAFMKYFEL